MKAVSKTKFMSGRGIRGVTVMPPFMLGFIGFTIAKIKPDKYVERFAAKMRKNETNECISAEVILASVRADAALALQNVSASSATTPPDAVPPGTASDKDIRASRKAQSEYNSRMMAGEAAANKIVSCRQEIIKVDTVLLERLNATHEKAMSKIDALLHGIRKRISGYDYQIDCGDAYELYRRKNEDLDNMLKLSKEDSYEIAEKNY